MLIVTRTVSFREIMRALGQGEQGHCVGGSFNKVIPTRQIPCEGSNLFPDFSLPAMGASANRLTSSPSLETICHAAGD